MGNKNIPEIRFKGFSDPWEQRKLGEVKDVRDGTHDSPKYHQNGYPLVTSKNLKEYGLDMNDISLISGQDFESISKRSKVDVGDILFGMIGTIGNPIIVNRDDFAIKNVALIKKGGIIPNKFLLPLLKSPIFETYIRNENAGNTQKFLGLSKIRDFSFLTPNSVEMELIGNFFDSLDKIITLHQRKLDKLKCLKKSYLQKMFPRNGETKPELRFDGFKDAWEQRKLSGVIEKLSGGASIKPTDYLEDGIRTIPKGAVSATGIADLSGSKYISEDFFEKNITSHVHTNNLVTSLRDLVPSAPNMGRIVRIEGDDEQFLMPQGVYKLELFKGMDEDFLISFSNSDKYRKIISAEKNGSTQVHIRNGEFLNIDINLPSKHEQKKIGTFFKILDNTIALHQRKLDKLKLLKKFYLQKMFV